ncbi:hypothetical protein [Magnetospirillum molischianum]|uniref:Putative methyl-accepting chemotaxis sensory transducer n=1 Tax=Magnetospirillum molischianum DSM 120 TaxID=1150626 RepID=H8FNK3_MAGML|nr:hypothetical protein [Magnetospirillum molischianum]CCG39941.1 Putative methyl-accepting chemotaxis sensory transducer [Magnetospirillum molischianum DSM 120]
MDNLAARSDVSGLHDILHALDTLNAELEQLAAPNEAAFITLGDALASARTTLSTGSVQFHALSEMLDSENGNRAERMIASAREDILSISTETREIASSLGQLDQRTGAVAKPLGTLAKIISEISALGINAKIHAAQVNAQGIDFTVFTKDIDRLQQLADDTIKRASGQLGSLSMAMASARLASDSFQRGDAVELESIGTRMGGQLAELAARRETVRRALPDIEKRTSVIAERVSRSISALQINDMTSQRFEHVRSALALMRGLTAPPSGTETDWLHDLNDERKQQILASVCSLQAQQMERAVADFSQAIRELKGNLTALGTEASTILTEAQSLFGGDSGDKSFIETVATDIERAAVLLDNYCQADERVRMLIHQVSEVFACIAKDLSALRSIDADLRIMGLNATLKCTRLGTSGHALGVVAQELRACSRRTEEISRLIAAAIDAATAEALALAERSEREHATAAALAGNIAESTRSMRTISGMVDKTLSDLMTACDRVSRLLGEATANFNLEHSLESGVGVLVGRLTDLGHQAAPGGVDPAVVREDIQRMLGQHYTMSSERIIHDIFADGEALSSPPPATGASAESDIDDFFF